ncbi:MAG: hypothetical protein LBS76_03705 [Mycoplasmataceae bacterium]|nr:hypothetical protein [Mycoplasmataceae bacterium]
MNKKNFEELNDELDIEHLNRKLYLEEVALLTQYGVTTYLRFLGLKNGQCTTFRSQDGQIESAPMVLINKRK